jgi:hypothetical protein
MINVFRPRTYPEVARELAEGLRFGDVLLGRDETQEELASFAWFALNFVHPTKMSYIASTTLAAEMAPVPGQGKLVMEVGVEAFESLPREVRDQLIHQSEGLRRRGVQVEVTDREGRPLPAGDLLTVT